MGNHGASSSKKDKDKKDKDKKDKDKKGHRKPSGHSSQGGASSSKSASGQPAHGQAAAAIYMNEDPNAGFYDPAQYRYQDQVQQYGAGGTDVYGGADQQGDWQQQQQQQQFECIPKWSCCMCGFSNMSMNYDPACVNPPGPCGHLRCEACPQYIEYVSLPYVDPNRSFESRNV